MFHRCQRFNSKPIQRLKGVQEERSKGNRRAPWSGAPDCPVCHLTVSGAPRTVRAELFTFGFLENRSAIIHRTVRCAKRSNGRQRNGRLQRSADNVNSARTARAESEQRQKAHRTVNSDCLVQHRTVRWPHLSELQRLGDVAGAPDCPVRPSTGSLPQRPLWWLGL